jgi:hypothetical protein
MVMGGGIGLWLDPYTLREPVEYCLQPSGNHP